MSSYVPDPKGIGATLTSRDMRRAVDDLAKSIGDGVDKRYPVELRSYTTDRAATAVTITNAYALADEAKHGVLTKAAAAVGHEVHARKR